jgi:hypothetical protein
MPFLIVERVTGPSVRCFGVVGGKDYQVATGVRHYPVMVTWQESAGVCSGRSLVVGFGERLGLNGRP